MGEEHQRMGTTPSPPGRRSFLLSVVALLALLVGVALAHFLTASETSPGKGWIRVGSIQDVRTEGVVSLPEVPAYVVADPPRTPIAFRARSPHLGEPITYCQSSGWFEDRAHGAMFDRRGNYVLGPADRGLDRLGTLVQNGVVWVNPNEVSPGAPRGSGMFPRPAGPFCSGMD
jgi:phenylpropionate dioxygenase-like ring-hydroxylating dioxygenase large terminal subunit